MEFLIGLATGQRRLGERLRALEARASASSRNSSSTPSTDASKTRQQRRQEAREKAKELAGNDGQRQRADRMVTRARDGSCWVKIRCRRSPPIPSDTPRGAPTPAAPRVHEPLPDTSCPWLSSPNPLKASKIPGAVQPAVACGSWSAKSSRRTWRACDWSVAAASVRLVCTTATVAWTASGGTCCSSSGYSATQTGWLPGSGRSCGAGSGVLLDELALGLGVCLAIIGVALGECSLQRHILVGENRVGA